jgi:hypothetical protein
MHILAVLMYYFHISSFIKAARCLSFLDSRMHRVVSYPRADRKLDIHILYSSYLKISYTLDYFRVQTKEIFGMWFAKSILACSYELLPSYRDE